MKSQEVRATFLQFFADRQHTIVPSAPIVVKNDPTLMFTNAGMNPFKDYFLGNKIAKTVRIANTQKCLRVSGKHNDLEEVGIDTYHHTMFEMLGNWSFGDYFKKEAIEWAWELLTRVYKLDKDRLYVTVFEGADGLPADEEARNIWKTQITEDRIIDGNKKDNFWEMGDTGPCGPCSEIHIDLRSEKERKAVPGKALVNTGHPQVIEIWNLVFMEYNRKADGSLEKLPAQHVDTGMGFERLCRALQGVSSNYDTDIFTPLIREIETITGTRYNENDATDVAIRVIADHIRAVSFAIADGQLPSNTGAGYVIRRILRRAIRYGFTFLHQKEPFIYKLVATLGYQVEGIFPEIGAQKNLVENVIREEERSFLKTLEQGLMLLDTMLSVSKEKIFPGAKAFELYDTFGFPIDLTQLILRERGIELDEKGFEAALQQQKNRSRAATKTFTGDWVVLRDGEEEEFVGYDTLRAPVKIVRYREWESKKDGVLYQLVFNLTPFYPEGGGQVGDKGYLEAPNGDVIYIIDTKREGGSSIHLVKHLPKDVEAVFMAVVDERQRKRAAANHSATHLLHQGLRAVLGAHVEQKGSMVHSGYLRFDFSHFAKVSADELREVENFVNARIQEGLPLVERRAMRYEEAIAGGAIGLFGEKYGDLVRTVRFGESMELCGGTHVSNTAEIWHFIITSESAVATGIRRIEAITSDAAKTYFIEQCGLLHQLKEALRMPQDPLKVVLGLQEENDALRKRVEELLEEKAKRVEASLIHELREVKGVRLLTATTDLDAVRVKNTLFRLGELFDNLFALVVSEEGEKVLLSCYISRQLVEKRGYNASLVVKELSRYIDGGGGGQAFFATAGGKNKAGIQQALEKAEGYVL